MEHTSLYLANILFLFTTTTIRETSVGTKLARGWGLEQFKRWPVSLNERSRPEF
ncbi:hypothetical protein RSAG8_10336, partial [Rhizoctonia solani AG-8 WAC10335]